MGKGVLCESPLLSGSCTAHAYSGSTDRKRGLASAYMKGQPLPVGVHYHKHVRSVA